MLDEIADLIANAQRLLGQIPRLCDEDRGYNELSGIDDELDEARAELAEASAMAERALRLTPAAPPVTIPFDQAAGMRVTEEGETQ